MVVILAVRTMPSVHGMIRWRLVSFSQWLWDCVHLSVSTDRLRRKLRRLISCRLSVRPRHHVQAPDGIKTTKNAPTPRHWEGAPRTASRKRIELRGGDKAWLSQKNMISRRWTCGASRSSVPDDQRTAAAYIFAVICADVGKRAAIVSPVCSTATMIRHLVASAAKCPNPNAQNNVQDVLRDSYCSNLIFTSSDNIVDCAYHTWNRLIDGSWYIRAVGLRNWPDEFCPVRVDTIK